MESDLLGLNLTIFDINFVSDKADRDVVANADKILVPLGHILVGDARCDIEHDDTALASNVVAVTKATEFLLSGSVPDVELDRAFAGEEWHRAHLDSNSCIVLLLKLASGVSLDECGLADTAITDEDELEFRHLSGLHC